MLKKYNDRIKQELLHLKAEGITKVQIDYQGQGDSGDVGAPVAYKGDREYLYSAEHLSFDLTSILYELLEDGWEINEGSEGSLVFDLKEDKIVHTNIEFSKIEDKNSTTWSLNGEPIPPNVSEPCLSQSVCTLQQELKEAAEELSILKFWKVYPEICSIKIEWSMEYDDEGGYYKNPYLTDIKFSDEEGLAKRLKKTKNDSWDDILVDEIRELQLGDRHYEENLIRPADVDEAIRTAHESIKQYVFRAARSF
jgi:hypothetical protein